MFYNWVKQYKDLDDLRDVPLKKRGDNLQWRYEKSQQICEVLRTVDCTCDFPLQTKLYEMEKHSVRVPCKALDVSRRTFYNHVLRNKNQNTSMFKDELNFRTL